MSPKNLISVAFLVFLALHNDAHLIKRRLINEFSITKIQYACPKSFTPEIASSPLQAGFDSLHYGETKQHFSGPPVPLELLKVLDIVVLPSREVCVLGERINNYILPEHSQFETLLSIAAWGIPCMSGPIHTKRSHCFDQQMSFIGSDDNRKFQRFSRHLVAAIQNYYYKINFANFFK
jgi:hypothetical protein